jgi:hypothetical protein
MDSNPAFLVFGAAAIAAVLVTLILLLYRADKRHVRSCISRCARENGFEVLDSEERSFQVRPFRWTFAGPGRVFRVRVYDSSKQERYVWIRLIRYLSSPAFGYTAELLPE